MNIAIIGYGKMGKGIARMLKSGQKLVLTIDAGQDINSVNKKILDSIDIFFEFTTPDAAKENILSIIKLKDRAKIVCGTTGWNVKEIEKDLIEHKALLLHSSNFSVGVKAVASCLNDLSTLISKTKEFKASILELHHIHKKDKPSGTARMLADIIEKNGINCPVESVREGEHVGTHTITFESGFEKIEIKHEAKNRDVFCVGALFAAEWLYKQDRPGLYSFAHTNI